MLTPGLTRSFELTVVVPVTLMAGRLNKLEEWLKIATGYPIQVLIIHDKRDIATGEQLATLVRHLNTEDIEVIEGKFGNPGTARNQGITKASGKWITFWDSDDSPCVESVMSEIKEIPNSIEVIVGSFRKADEYAGVISNWDKPRNLQHVAMNPGVWRMIFRTASIENSRFPALLMAEDQVFLSEFRLAERQIQFTSRGFYTYVIGNPEQLTKSKLALADLPRAMLKIGIRKSQVSNRQLKLDMFLISRQLLTSLRKATRDIKISAIVAILRIVRENGWISIFYLINSIAQISTEKFPWKMHEKQ